MKLVCCLFFVFILSSCVSQNIVDKRGIKYEAVTRGSFIEITSNLESLVYKNMQKSKEIKLTESQIKKLKTLLGKINLSELENLKPPSTKSYTDAALQATLKLTYNSKIFTSQVFDHGNPPKELKSLLEYLFKIGQK